MSRGQENQAFNTASSQNQQFNENAQQSYKNAQGDITDYENQLAKFAAANPYGAGGEFDTETNKVLANTSDAAAQAAGQALQGAAVRTGQNANGAIAATEAMQETNERNLAGQEAKAQQERIGNEAGYNEKVLGASEVPARLESELSGQQAGAGNGALGIEQRAGEQPSFLDTLGSSFAEGLGSSVGKIAGGGFGKIPGCWVAAELYGGWEDERTILLRIWLHEVFRRTWYGAPLVWAYQRWGERLAEAIKTRPRLRRAMRVIFDAGVRRAEAWHDGAMRRLALGEADARGPMMLNLDALTAEATHGE